MAVYKYYRTRWYTNVYLYLIKRLSVWVLGFLITRTVPTAFRLIVLINPNFKSPLWLVLCHNYLITSLGIANGIVWYFTQKIGPNTKHSIDSTSTQQKAEPLLDTLDTDTTEMTTTFNKKQTESDINWESYSSFD